MVWNGLNVKKDRTMRRFCFAMTVCHGIQCTDGQNVESLLQFSGHACWDSSTHREAKSTPFREAAPPRAVISQPFEAFQHTPSQTRLQGRCLPRSTISARPQPPSCEHVYLAGFKHFANPCATNPGFLQRSPLFLQLLGMHKRSTHCKRHGQILAQAAESADQGTSPEFHVAN